MLKISDLTGNKEMDSKAMSAIRGGTSELADLSALIDFSSNLTNKVNDVDQVFALDVGQANTGAVSNEQIFIGNNGLIYAPVNQSQRMANFAQATELGRVLLG